MASYKIVISYTIPLKLYHAKSTAGDISKKNIDLTLIVALKFKSRSILL